MSKVSNVMCKGEKYNVHLSKGEKFNAYRTVKSEKYNALKCE